MTTLSTDTHKLICQIFDDINLLLSVYTKNKPCETEKKEELVAWRNYYSINIATPILSENRNISGLTYCYMSRCYNVEIHANIKKYVYQPLRPSKVEEKLRHQLVSIYLMLTDQKNLILFNDNRIKLDNLSMIETIKKILATYFFLQEKELEAIFNARDQAVEHVKILFKGSYSFIKDDDGINHQIDHTKDAYSYLANVVTFSRLSYLIEQPARLELERKQKEQQKIREEEREKIKSLETAAKIEGIRQEKERLKHLTLEFEARENRKDPTIVSDIISIVMTEINNYQLVKSKLSYYEKLFQPNDLVYRMLALKEFLTKSDSNNPYKLLLIYLLLKDSKCNELQQKINDRLINYHGYTDGSIKKILLSFFDFKETTIDTPHLMAHLSSQKNNFYDYDAIKNNYANFEAQLTEHTFLKQAIKQLVMDYQSSRRGVITFFFRNHKLTDDKQTMANQLLALLEKGIDLPTLKQEFLLRLDQHKNLSRSAGKNHFNLVESSSERKGRIYLGEASNQSGFAEVLHQAIALIESSMSIASLI